MAPAVKRRKTSTTTSARAIDNSFAKITRASTTASIIDKTDSVTEEINSKKRKLVVEDKILPVTIERDLKPRRKLPQTPQKAIKTSSIETPTRGATSLLDLLLISKQTPTRSPLVETSNLASTPAAELPTELLDLIDLHAAFLTALSLHYAHNGTASPADIRLLCPDVARAWGKRKVLLEDIRRTLGVQNTGIPDGNKDRRLAQLTLSDYGRGKICIEIEIFGKATMRPINEDAMNNVFSKTLIKLWETRAVEATFPEFLKSLPKESITACTSMLQIAPLLAKGQRRLDDMKAGFIKRDTQKDAARISTSGSKPTLLERLRAKQLHQSLLPCAPSPADLSRKAALQRVEEVSAVLRLLSSSSSVGQQRVSFTMASVILKLKDSFKSTLAKEEADACLKVLASEIAPKWVQIVKLGKKEAVVVDREERPSEEEIRKRVGRACRA